MSKRSEIASTRSDIERHPTVAFRVLEVIWNRQSDFEKFTGTYGGSDGKGFQEHETPEANDLYDRYEAAGKRWHKMSAIDVQRCRTMMAKYAKQYLEATHAKEERHGRAKINRHPVRKKLTKEERQQRWEMVERLEAKEA